MADRPREEHGGSVTIKLGYDHPGCVRAAECVSLAVPLHAQLSNGNYDWPASILELEDFTTYIAAHRTARKRAARAARLGYTSERIDRANHADDIYAINTSAPERQGRPMSAGYLERPDFSPLGEFPCARHRIDQWGVFAHRGRLVAYLVLYVCGDLAMISQILGHADHLADDIMYLLTLTALEETLKAAGPVTLFYNRHDSGTEGLRYFKERLGFAPERVAWAL